MIRRGTRNDRFPGPTITALVLLIAFGGGCKKEQVTGESGARDYDASPMVMVIDVPVQGEAAPSVYELQLPADERVRAGLARLRRGDHQGAIDLFERVAAERPNDLETRFALGLLHEKSGSLDDAARIYSDLARESAQPRFEEAASRVQTRIPTGVRAGPLLRDIMAGGVPVSVHVSPNVIRPGEKSTVRVSLADEFDGDLQILYLPLRPGVNTGDVLDGPRRVACAGREADFEVEGVGGVPFPCDVGIGVIAGNLQVEPESGATLTVEP